jgi:putative ubiquitin-RnfH superfamily antitoxin RatB of RatAB toxin-antitoxin module
MATLKGGLANPAEPAVEVVYARADVQSVVRLALPPAGMTAAQAITASGLCGKYPELAAGNLVVGIFGKPCESSHVLQPGDRVEIYRPLRNDPRAMRRARVAATPKSGRGAKNKPGVTR